MDFEEEEDCCAKKLEPPNGVLAIHVREMQLLDSIKNELPFNADEFNLYLRITTAETVQYTSMFTRVSVPCLLPFDDIRHISVTIGSTRIDPLNQVFIDLIVKLPTVDHHHILNRVTMNLCNIAQNHLILETFEHLSIKDKCYAKTQIEFCFSYGSFGYGQSSQLDSKKTQPKNNLKHTMFPRVYPNPDEEDESNPSYIRPVYVGHPVYIPFTSKVQFSIADELQEDIDELELDQVYEPKYVIPRLRRRLRERMKEFGEQQTRDGRLKYLTELIHHPSQRDLGSVEGHFTMPQEVKLKHRPAKSTPMFGGNLMTDTKANMHAVRERYRENKKNEASETSRGGMFKKTVNALSRVLAFMSVAKGSQRSDDAMDEEEEQRREEQPLQRSASLTVTSQKHIAQAADGDVDPVMHALETEAEEQADTHRQKILTTYDSKQPGLLAGIFHGLRDRGATQRMEVPRVMIVPATPSDSDDDAESDVDEEGVTIQDFFLRR